MRLDLYLCEKLNVISRTRAKYLMEKGLVFVDGKLAKKPSMDIKGSEFIEIKEANTFASRGGEKLLRGLISFNFDVKNKVFLDVGASNGGFTDCLLKNGASKVYAIDIGENQLEDFLKQDERVVILDNTNARDLKREQFVEEQLFIVSDLSFISLTLVISVFSKLASEMLLLIKPQFECGKRALNKNGIVKDKTYHLEAIKNIKNCLRENGLFLSNLAIASNKKNKNIEYIGYISKENEMKDSEVLNIIKNIDILYLHLE